MNRAWLIIVSVVCFERAAAQRLVICPVKMNVLYVGVENPVEIGVDGRRCVEYSLRMPDAEVKKISNCSYTIKPKPLSVGSRNAFVLNANGGIVDSFTFRVKRIPGPIAKLVGKSREGGVYIGRSSGIAAVPECFDFDARFEVIDFDVTIEGRDSIIIFQKKNDTGSGYFNKEVKEAIGKMKPGDRFIARRIKAKGPDGFVRELNDVVSVAW